MCAENNKKKKKKKKKNVSCQVSHVIYHMPHVTCQMSHVTRHMSLMPTATATDPPSDKSPTMHSRMTLRFYPPSEPKLQILTRLCSHYISLKKSVCIWNLGQRPSAKKSTKKQP